MVLHNDTYFKMSLRISMVCQVKYHIHFGFWTGIIFIVLVVVVENEK